MYRKISPSTIKYIPDDPSKFKAKFAYKQETKFFKKEFVIGRVLHKIAEIKCLGNTPTLEDAINELENEIGNLTVIVKNEVKRLYKLNEVEEIRDMIKILFDYFIQQVPEGLPEGQVGDENFIGFIDLLTEEEVVDYKLVNKFSSLSDGYLIQGAFYAKFYPEKKRVRFIEISKPKTDFKYITKNDIIDMIEREHNIDISDARTDKKQTRELLVSKYPITGCGRKDIIIDITPELLSFADDMCNKAINLRELSYAMLRDEDVNDEFSVGVYEFKELLKEFRTNLKGDEQETE